MSEREFDADSTQPAFAGMRAMPQGVIGGARPHKTLDPRPQAKAELVTAKAAFSAAAVSALRGKPGAVQQTEAALQQLEAAFARISHINNQEKSNEDFAVRTARRP